MIIASMEPEFPEILQQQEHAYTHESPRIGIAVIPDSSSTRLRSFLLISDHPRLCVNRILISPSFQKLRDETLKRLTYSNHSSIRSAAELELSTRSLRKGK